jgi:hypothetical protein
VRRLDAAPHCVACLVGAPERGQRLAEPPPAVPLVVVAREVEAQLLHRLLPQLRLQQLVRQPEAGEDVVGVLRDHRAEGVELGHRAARC